MGGCQILEGLLIGSADVMPFMCYLVSLDGGFFLSHAWDYS
jgi:hypothetical protein